MLSCQLKPMMRISRQSCHKVQALAPDAIINATDLVNNRGQLFVDAPFDHSTYVIIEITMRVFAIGTVATFGVISNIINLVIFYRQGILSSSPTVSLTALAVSDFYCCLFNVWGAICGALINFTDVSSYKWDVSGFLVFTAVRPLDVFTQITCWVTAFMTFERLVSVAFPFVVKAIFTPKRTLAVLACIYFFTLILYAPNSFEEMPVHKTKRKSNFTYIGWENAGVKIKGASLRTVFFFLNPIILRFASIIIVLLCNIVIFWKVNLSQKFRKASAPPSSSISKPSKSGKEITSTKMKETQSESCAIPSAPPSPTEDDLQNQSSATNVTTTTNKTTTNTTATTTTTTTKIKTATNNTKEMKLLRMITVISAVFVLCYTMNAIYVVLFYLIWMWGVHYHAYIDYTAWLVVTLFQTANSSCNILIYQTMSSRFRQDLHLLCSRREKSM